MAKRGVPARLRRVPSFVLDMLATQVDGDWSRVTADEHGAVTIHNRPIVEDEKPKPRRALHTAEPRRPAHPTPAVLDGVLRSPVRETIGRRPSVQRDRRLPVFIPPAAPEPLDRPIPAAPAVPPPVRFVRPAPNWLQIPGIKDEGDWERMGLAQSAHALSLQLATGLPPGAPLGVNPDVLALSGVDVLAAEAVARKPERVLIAEETSEKKYPVLTFHRGDVTVVLGFRIPHRPQMIAAYFTGEALKEYQRSRELTGGGGKRAGEGVPKHPRLLKRRLQETGATVAADPDGLKAVVRFRDQTLGKITLEGANPQLTENDWQRMQRMISAIKRREESSSRAG